jgi:hypothetical protein
MSSSEEHLGQLGDFPGCLTLYDRVDPVGYRCQIYFRNACQDLMKQSRRVSDTVMGFSNSVKTQNDLITAMLCQLLHLPRQETTVADNRYSRPRLGSHLNQLRKFPK